MVDGRFGDSSSATSGSSVTSVALSGGVRGFANSDFASDENIIVVTEESESFVFPFVNCLISGVGNFDGSVSFVWASSKTKN